MPSNFLDNVFALVAGKSDIPGRGAQYSANQKATASAYNAIIEALQGIHARFGDLVTVSDKFDLAGDGETDDSDAFQEFIDYCATTTTKIGILKPGTYLLNSTVQQVDAKGVRIIFAGGRKTPEYQPTILKWGGEADGTVFEAKSCDGCEWIDWAIDGDETAGVGFHLWAEEVTGPSRQNRVVNLFTKDHRGDPGQGLKVGDSIGYQCSENRFDGIWNYGDKIGCYHEGDQCIGNIFSGGETVNCTQYGMYWRSGQAHVDAASGKRTVLMNAGATAGFYVHNDVTDVRIDGAYWEGTDGDGFVFPSGLRAYGTSLTNCIGQQNIEAPTTKKIISFKQGGTFEMRGNRFQTLLNPPDQEAVIELDGQGESPAVVVDLGNNYLNGVKLSITPGANTALMMASHEGSHTLPVVTQSLGAFDPPKPAVKYHQFFYRFALVLFEGFLSLWDSQGSGTQRRLRNVSGELRFTDEDEDLLAKLDGSGNLSTTGDVTVGDDLTVTDDALVSGDLAVTGGATVGAGLAVTGALTFTGAGTAAAASATTSNNAAGSSTTPAKADHVHEINVGSQSAAASGDTTHNTATPTTIDSMSLVMDAGTYLVMFSAYGNTGHATDGGSYQFYFDSSPNAIADMPPSATVNHKMMLMAHVTLPGSMTMTVKWFNGGAGNTLTCKHRVITAIRLS